VRGAMNTACRLLETVISLPLGEEVSTNQVREFVGKRGFTVSHRTTERDLLKLAGRFGIEHTGTTNVGYRWKRTRHLEPA
jgi:hypothetical protein